MKGPLIDLIDRLDEVDDSDPYRPKCIFAEVGADSSPTARAIICAGDEDGSFACPEDADLSYVLQVEQAKECVEVWSEWRGGRRPTREDKFAAVMHYSRYGAWLPLDETRAGN